METDQTQSSMITIQMCEECGADPSKYKCPGCGLRSCGLPCVQLHKVRTGCSGKRDRTAFVARNEYNDNNLISDYNFLEETLRVLDVAKRIRPQDLGLTWVLRTLKNQARNRKIDLRLLPHGLSKRNANTTYYDKKTKCMFWRIEWLFDSVDVNLTNERVDENVSLQRVLEKHFSFQPQNAILRHQLRDYIQTASDQLKFLLKKEPSLAGREAYYTLNANEPIRQVLANKVVYEYPVILVVLSTKLDKFSILEDNNCLDPNREDHVSPVPSDLPPGAFPGIPFREEELEEGEIDVFDCLEASNYAGPAMESFDVGFLSENKMEEGEISS